MPKYKCKDCGAVWHSWGAGKVCPKYEGKLEPVPEKIPLIKNRPGPPQG